MAKESPGLQNVVLVVQGPAHAQAIFLTPGGPRLTKAIPERLVNHAKRLRGVASSIRRDKDDKVN